jgi:hypothetical protein
MSLMLTINLMKEADLLKRILDYRNKHLAMFSVSWSMINKLRTRSPSKERLLILEIILRIWIFFQRFSIRRKLPKYVFMGKFHHHIISILPNKEVMVMGGINELLFCIKNGYRFFWTGFIFYGFNLFIFSKKNNLFNEAINALRKIFSKDNNKRYLFLPNDSLPEGMTLSFGLESTPMLNIICIAHGIINFEATRISVTPEGESCKFNLVWSESQKSFFKNDVNHISFVLGLPYEVNPPQSQCKEVIFVGHCGPSGAFQYFFSMYHFTKLYRMFQAAGINVLYRPHPQDNIEKLLNFFKISFTEKNELLTSSSRIFIGLESSLLFEAHEFGHTTIGLNFLELNHKHNRAFDVDFEVDSDNFESLPDLILDIIDKNESKKNAKHENLKTRFDRCLYKIDEFNSTHKSDSL